MNEPSCSHGDKLYQRYIVPAALTANLGIVLGSIDMPSILRRLLVDDRAVTAVEYALIVCLIATAAVAGMTTAGHSVMNMLGPMASALT
jgi:Flp pilus assembly pilin Flp